MKVSILLTLGLLVSVSVMAQVGGRCEGCEAIYEYGDKKLNWVDTLPDYQDKGPKLILQGTVFKNDGRTPADGVILYVYHTDQGGIYPTKGDEKGWARRHGYIRGWVKTNKDGDYKFYTLKPGHYPSGSAPMHVHITIKEPELQEYWIDSWHFEDDPKLTASMVRGMQSRGGSGVVSLREIQGHLIAERDIILGKNVPGYPE